MINLQNVQAFQKQYLDMSSVKCSFCPCYKGNGFQHPFKVVQSYTKGSPMIKWLFPFVHHNDGFPFANKCTP